MIYRLVYASSAAKGITQSDLREIAKTSESMNKSYGITGMLLWYEGNIMQVLEGDSEAVLKLYSNIRNDVRNSGCYVLYSGHFEKREFPNWSMGYQVIQSETQLPYEFLLSRSTFETILKNMKDTILSSLTKTYGQIANINL